MSSKENLYDHSVIESFFHTLKAELIYQCYHASQKTNKYSNCEVEGFNNIVAEFLYNSD